MSRPKLRVIQGGAAGTPEPRGKRPPSAPPREEPGRAPRSRRFAAAQAEATAEPVRARAAVRRARPATRRQAPTALTWLFAAAAMGGVVVAWAGQVLIGGAMVLGAAAAMISPPTAPVAGRARTISMGLLAAATVLAVADIGLSLLG